MHADAAVLRGENTIARARLRCRGACGGDCRHGQRETCGCADELHRIRAFERDVGRLERSRIIVLDMLGALGLDQNSGQLKYDSSWRSSSQRSRVGPEASLVSFGTSRTISRFK